MSGPRLGQPIISPRDSRTTPLDLAELAVILDDDEVAATERVVAKTNALTAATAHRWIYAARFPFRWALPVVGIIDGPSPLLRHGRPAERRSRQRVSHSQRPA